MLTKEQEAEYWAMHYYLGGDCNCCDHQGECENFENLVFPSKENCAWKFSTTLVREYKEMYDIIDNSAGDCADASEVYRA